MSAVNADSVHAGSIARAGIESALCWIFLTASLLLTIPAMGNGVLWGDVAVARFIQRINLPALGDGSAMANWLGASAQLAVLTILASLVLAATRRYAAAGLVAATVGAHAANTVLKAIAESPRPTTGFVQISEIADGFGFPSGHAMGVALFYGAIVVIAHEHVSHRGMRLAIQFGALAMIVATGFGRIYAGAHWPSDVVGGYLWGITALLALRQMQRMLSTRPFPAPVRSLVESGSMGRIRLSARFGED